MLDAHAGSVGREARRHNGAMQRSALSYIVAAIDAVIITASAVGSGFAYHYFVFGYVDSLAKHFAIGMVFALGFTLLMTVRGYYRPSILVFVAKQSLYVALCSFLLATFLAFIVFLVGASDAFSRATIAIFAGTSTIGVIGSRFFWARYIREATSRGLVQKKKIVLIRAAGQQSEANEDGLRHLGLEAAQVIDVDETDNSDFLARVSLAMTRNVSDIYVMTEGLSRDAFEDVARHLRTLPVPVQVILDPFVAQFAAMPANMLGDITVTQLQRAPLNLAERYTKRSFDIAVSAAALLFFAPLMLLAAIAIKLDSPGPVFYRQQRRGFNNEPFRIFKFRSMTVTEADGTMTQAVQNDARITRIGKFIRSTSVDELPQFLNVLLGDMSVVGPRPHAVSQEDHYDHLIARYAFRRHVKPGITGWAQINGHRGATPTVSSMESRLEHDLWYMHHWSLWLDVRITLRTFGAMFDRSSAF